MLEGATTKLCKIIEYGKNLAKNEENPSSICLQPISQLKMPEIIQAPVKPLLYIEVPLKNEKKMNAFVRYPKEIQI